MDAQVGRVTNALSELGLWATTLVVLASDHGWKLGEHLAWGKFSNAEEDTHVPLIVVPPDTDVASSSLRGVRRDEIVELVDIYPTILDLCGLLDFRNSRGVIASDNNKNRNKGKDNTDGAAHRPAPLEGSSLRMLLNGSVAPGSSWKT